MKPINIHVIGFPEGKKKNYSNDDQKFPKFDDKH